MFILVFYATKFYLVTYIQQAPVTLKDYSDSLFFWV